MSPITLHTTPHGRPAAMRLRERISATKADDPLRPVTVVVPTNYVGVSARRLLASGVLGPVTDRGEGIAGLTLLTVYRLAELLGAPRLAADGRRPVSTPVIAAAVRQVLGDEPGIFAPVREHPATEEALVWAHRELSEVRPESLDLLAKQSQRADDVVRVHRAVRELIEPDWYEEADLMAAAGEAVRAGSPVLADLGTVILHLPQDLSLPAADLLRTVAAHTDLEVVAALTGAAGADADVRRSLDRLGIDAPDDRLDAPADLDPTPPTATEVVSVSDPEEEVRSAVSAVVDAARDGVPLESMAICYPSPEPYARIVHEQLDAAGVPYSGRAVRPLADRLVGRWLLDLMELPGRRFARPAVMSLLAEAPVRGRDGSWLPTGTWERISRDAGIVHDRDEWHDKLLRYAADQRRLAEQEERGDEAREWLVDRRRGNAEAADALRGHVGNLFDALDEARGLASWRRITDWCRRMIRDHLGSARRQARWPEVEREAADRVDEALERLAGLDGIEPSTDLPTFRRTLELELDADLGRVGELGRGVLVGTPTAALGLDLQLVVVLGLAEGVFPTLPREDSLLPDAERAVIADQLRPRADRVGVEHRRLLAALAASRGRRVLTFPRGDLRRSVERAPSRWLRESVAALSGGATDDPADVDASAPWFTEVPSFSRRMERIEFPATRRAYGLRALAARPPRRPLHEHPLVAGDRRLDRGVRLSTQRRSGAFTRFDGDVSRVAEAVTSPTDRHRPVSATRLETWLDCPHAYLMEYVLRVRPVDNPEEILEISPLERGSLIHDDMEAWLKERLSDCDLPPPDRPWAPVTTQRMRSLAEEACRDADERGVTGHPLLWRRDRARICRDLVRFVAADDERRRELHAMPEAAEWSFGLPPGDTEPVEIDLGDGRSVLVRGRIDRIDRTADGTAVVTDYKTGSPRSYTELTQDRPLGDGTRLQLPIYGLAVRDRIPDTDDVRVDYWFTTARRTFRRIGYELTDAVVARLREALRLVVDGIEAGRFPMRPPEPGWSLYTDCLYCDPDELGTADRHRRWERLRHVPELRDYVAHVEPDALGDAESPGEEAGHDRGRKQAERGAASSGSGQDAAGDEPQRGAASEQPGTDADARGSP